MKKIITTIALTLSITFLISQTQVADFESFSLPANSAYKDTTNTPFQMANASFQYKWNGYWSGGFSYTNKYDSTTASFTNLYGVKPLKGYNNSNKYCVGQDKGVINLSAPSNTVIGFYITNTTFAYESMENGDAFAKKFGGISGNDPDFFKITIKGYKGGTLLQDSVTFYLADFRFTNNSLDYIVDSWQWVNTSTLGNVDSVKFFMYSSDVGNFGINTPLFFGIDNFTSIPSSVGITEIRNNLKFDFYPNPSHSEITILNTTAFDSPLHVKIIDMTNNEIYSQELDDINTTLNISFLEKGMYILQVSSSKGYISKKLIKN